MVVGVPTPIRRAQPAPIAVDPGGDAADKVKGRVGRDQQLGREGLVTVQGIAYR